MGSLLAIGGAFIACGGDSSGDTGSDSNDATGDTGEGGGDLSIRFSPMYSAYDGVHDFKLPVVVQSVDAKGNVSTLKGVTFSASDKSKVDVENTPEGATLTMKGAGDVTITATKGGLKGTAKLHITQATPEQWQAGADRYMTMVDALPNGTQLTSFSSIDFNGACTTCHGDTAKIFKVMHTPQQTGGYSDEDLITIFTMGKKPEGYQQRSGIPACLWGRGHQWKVPEPMGLVVYLRSLKPQSQGDFDFPTPNLGDAGISIPNFTGSGGMLNIPAGICNFLNADGGFTLPPIPPGLFGDGGINLGGLFGDGGFRLPPGLGGGNTGGGNTGGGASDAGAPSAPTETSDAGTP